MRGRFTTWTRIRVNLRNVPPELRPEQEPLDPDYDPWQGYEWPDRSGQLERGRADADAGGQLQQQKAEPPPRPRSRP